MGDKLTFSLQGEYLLGVLEGEYTPEDLGMFSEEFPKAVEHYCVRKVLLDKRKFLNAFDYHDAVVFANSPLSDYMVCKGLRVASIIHPSARKVEETYETLMANRCVAYKPFTNKKQALAWLLS